jgi:hypothetical protein
MRTCRIIELRIEGDDVVACELPRPTLPAGFVSAGRRSLAARHTAHEFSDDFRKRVLDRQVDLVKRIRDGIPPIEYLPESESMFVRGKRHTITAPRKTGKSIANLSHCVRIALAEQRVIVLDRENGGNEYARRLEAIMSSWQLAPRDRTRIQRNLTYFEFPKFRAGDGADFRHVAAGADLVVFDAQRMFLTDLGLKEGDADDYATFAYELVEPLFDAGVATVVLDNTGHGDKTRPRGTSAKGDLAEVLFRLETVQEFSLNRQGKLKLSLKPGDSRFGNEGEWTMDIGGGAFSPWKSLAQEKPVDPRFVSAVEEELHAAGTEGLSQTALLKAIRERGVTFRNEDGRTWLYGLAADPETNVHLLPPDFPGQAARFHGGPDGDVLALPNRAGRTSSERASPGRGRRGRARSD